MTSIAIDMIRFVVCSGATDHHQFKPNCYKKIEFVFTGYYCAKWSIETVSRYSFFNICKFTSVWASLWNDDCRLNKLLHFFLMHLDMSCPHHLAAFYWDRWFLVESTRVSWSWTLWCLCNSYHAYQNGNDTFKTWRTNLLLWIVAINCYYS